MTRFTSLVLCSFAAFLSPVAVGAGHSINAEIAVSDAYMKPGSILSEPLYARSHNAVGEGASRESRYVCYAHLDKVFTRMPTSTFDVRWDKGNSPAWLESYQQGSVSWYAQTPVNKAAGVFQVYDMTRGIKLLFDARDEHAVLSYWCSISKCVWNILAIDG